MRMGYIGTRRKPMQEIARAFSMREGTTQIVTSNLLINVANKQRDIVRRMIMYWMASRAYMNITRRSPTYNMALDPDSIRNEK